MIDNKPKVSVILPTYNRAHLVGRAIQSVLNQTFQDLEIVVVDDASTDNSEEIVKNFSNPNIKYHRHESNRGANAARNTGISIAKGEYIAFNDSDDEWLPTKLEKQVIIIENTEDDIGIVYSGFYQIIGNVKSYVPSVSIKKKDGNIYKSLLYGNFVTTQTVLIKRECFEKVGFFDEELPRLQDWELWLRISKNYKFKFIDEPLVIANLQPNSISNDRNALNVALKLIINKHFEDEELPSQIRSLHHLELARSLYFSGRKKEAKVCYYKAVKLNPYDLRTFLDIGISLCGENIYESILKVYRLCKHKTQKR